MRLLERLLSSTHTINVPVLRQEMSGLVCGQDTDNAKWIRRETSPKGRFIRVCRCVRASVCVRLCVLTWFHFKLYQHRDLSEGWRAQRGVW